MKQFYESNKVWIYVVIGCALLAVVGISFGLYECFNTAEAKDISNPISFGETKEVAEDPNTFYVEVKGAVKKPGVYEANESMIINDLLSLAGGLKTTAYTDNINLSKHVSNEMVIYVYTKSAYKALKIEPKEVKVNNECTSSTEIINNCIDHGSSVIVPGEKDTVFVDKKDTIDNSSNTLVNINTATEKELTSLSGIGESKAISIIEYRNKNGLFEKIEDIKNVSGIGDAVYEKIKGNITV